MSVIEEQENNIKKLPSTTAASIYSLVMPILCWTLSIYLSLAVRRLGISEAISNSAALNSIADIVFTFLLSGLPVIVFLAVIKPDVKATLRLNPLQGKEILPLLFISLFTFAMNFMLSEANYLIVNIFTTTHDGTFPKIVTDWDKTMSVISIAFVAPVLEELSFRGCVMSGLEGKSKWFGIIMTGVIFGLLHLSLSTFVAKIMMGIVLCYVAYVTNSIYASMILHTVNNGITVILQIIIDSTTEIQELAEETTEAMTTMQSISTAVVDLMLAAVMFGLVVVGITWLRNAGKQTTEDGETVYKENLYEQQRGRKKLGKFDVLFLALSVALMVSVTLYYN